MERALPVIVFKMKKIKQAKSMGHKSKGTHGSLSKAGRIRGENPTQFVKDERGNFKRDKKGRKIRLGKKHSCPIVANRHRYKKLMEKPKRDFERMRRGFK